MKVPFLSVLLSGVLASAAAAQSTAFTYQGELGSGGTPANGLHDLRFSLFNAATAGTQVGVTVCADDVLVAEGRFTVTIDFGQRYATRQDRFLEIEVRRDTGQGCGNTTGFTRLAPRQPITAAPMASHARSAFALDASDGSPLEAVSVDNDGNVGIGTNSPQASLHILTPGQGIKIQGPEVGAPNGAYMAFADATGTDLGYVGDGSSGDRSVFLASYVQNVELITPFGRVLTARDNGNVGIGTQFPAAKLDVRGDIRLGSSGQFQAAAGVENLRLVRGDVRGNGTILRGAGFTCRRVNFGSYEITFTPPFSGPPSVALTTPFTGSAPARVAHYNANSVTPSSIIVITQTPPNEIPTDTDFSMCVIGPR